MSTDRQQRIDRVDRMLSEVSQIVRTTPELGDLYKQIHKLLGTVMDVSNFYIAIYDDRSNKVRFPYYVDTVDNHYIADGTTGLGTLENIVEYTIHPGKGSMTAMVINKGEALLISRQALLDYCQEKRCKPSGTPPEVWLGAPMKVGKRILGVIAVQSYTNPHQYREEDIPVLSAMCDHLALAVKRKLDETTLQGRELRHRNLVSPISEITYSTDHSGVIADINLVAETILDQPQATFAEHQSWYRFTTGETGSPEKPRLFEELIHPDDRRRAAIMLEDARDNKAAFQIEYRIKTGSTKNRWVLEKGHFINSGSSGPCLEGIILDIHDRKRAELINQVLFNISNAVNTTFNLDDLYRAIHQSLSRVIDVSNFYIALYDKGADSVSFPFDIDEKGNEIIKEIANVSVSPSLTGEVIKSGKPLLLTRIGAEKLLNKQSKDFIGDPAELWLGAPLKVRGEIIGAMVTQSYSDPDLYDAKDLETFLSVSDQIAIAIDRKRHEEALHQKELQLTTLFEISNAIVTAFNREELYQSIHKSLQGIIEVKNFGIALYDEEKDEIQYVYLVDEKSKNDYLIIDHASQSSSLAYQVIRQKKPLILGREDVRKLIEESGGEIIGTLCQSWLGLPLRGTNRILGALVIQDYEEPNYFKPKEIELLISVSGQIAFAIERKQAEADLEETQAELIAYAHKVGMADIANDTLHNIGNILTSVKVSTEQIDTINRESSLDNFRRATALLKEKLSIFDSAPEEKEIAGKLLDYFQRLETQFETEKSDIQKQVKRLNEKVNLMTDVIVTQQSFTNSGFLTGRYSIEAILEDALSIQAGMLHNNRIKIKRDFEAVPPVQVQKTKLMHILINLIINARDAMYEVPAADREISLSIQKVEEMVRLRIADTGMGISQEDFARLFTHGFTTKEKGHGFGLHNSARYLEEMKGKIWAESDGPGRGAVFIIELPVSEKTW